MENKEIKKISIEKEQSRNIVKEIENFGVNESQKIDIMYFLSLTLEDDNTMKEICNFLKKYKNFINIEENNNTIKTDDQKQTLILE